MFFCVFPNGETVGPRVIVECKISINVKQDKTKGDDDGDDCDVKDQHESTDGSAACPPRRASADLVAERCDAAICPESGQKRKRAFCT